MKGIEIVDNLMNILGVEHSLSKDFSMGAAHTQLLEIHARALAAHCECLGMNAENMWAAIANHPPVYLSKHYNEMMEKWGLVDKEGKPII